MKMRVALYNFCNMYSYWQASKVTRVRRVLCIFLETRRSGRYSRGACRVYDLFAVVGRIFPISMVRVDQGPIARCGEI